MFRSQPMMRSPLGGQQTAILAWRPNGHALLEVGSSRQRAFQERAGKRLVPMKYIANCLALARPYERDNVRRSHLG